MKWIESVFKFIFAIFFVGFLQLVFVYWLPIPLSFVHVVLIAIVLIIFLYEHGSIIWLSSIWFLFFEQLSLSPFGIILFAGVLTTVLLYMLYKEVLTNRSIYSAMTLFSIGYLSYRFIYVLLFGLYALFQNDISFHAWIFFKSYLLEWGISLLVLVGVFHISKLFSRQLKEQKIQESWFKKLGA